MDKVRGFSQLALDSNVLCHHLLIQATSFDLIFKNYLSGLIIIYPCDLVSDSEVISKVPFFNWYDCDPIVNIKHQLTLSVSNLQWHRFHHKLRVGLVEGAKLAHIDILLRGEGEHTFDFSWVRTVLIGLKDLTFKVWKQVAIHWDRYWAYQRNWNF